MNETKWKLPCTTPQNHYVVSIMQNPYFANKHLIIRFGTSKFWPLGNGFSLLSSFLESITFVGIEYHWHRCWLDWKIQWSFLCQILMTQLLFRLNFEVISSFPCLHFDNLPKFLLLVVWWFDLFDFFSSCNTCQYLSEQGSNI
jgi:hypothetical protein